MGASGSAFAITKIGLGLEGLGNASVQICGLRPAGLVVRCPILRYLLSRGMIQPSPPKQTQIEFVAASADMRDFVHALFVMRAGEGEMRSIMPAYSAQLLSFAEGSARLDFPGNLARASSDLTFCAPLLQAAPLTLDGPVTVIGASFTPIGWSIFSGLQADAVHDTAFAADTILSDAQLAPLSEALAKFRAGIISGKDYALIIEDVIRQLCLSSSRAPRVDHRELLQAIESWLESAFNPSVEDLYKAVKLGKRQVQRLCRRYYGVPPTQLAKRYRAIRAAMLLAHEDLSDQVRDEVLSAYFDQAHLIRDVRRYAGYTPKALSKESLVQNMLDPNGHGQSGRRLRKR